MARPTKRAIRARVKWWQKRLRLEDWEIVVEFGKDDDHAEAACLAAPEYRRATLFFDVAQVPAEQIDRYVCHELLHTLVWPLANAAHVMAGGDASKEEWVRTQEEGLVTALEHLFVGMMPGE